MPKDLFTPTEQGVLVLAAYRVQSDKDIPLYLAKLEKIFLNKLRDKFETEQALKLSQNK